MSLRFTAQARADLRRAIREADGVEVFAIGDVEDRVVTAVTIACRGRSDRVTALLDRPRAGQVVIHNHPSGVLEPSDADLHLAGLYGDDGVGFVIVDSDVGRDRWVVEPHVKRELPIELSAIDAFFSDALPRAIPDFEPRGGQLDMARAAARAMSENRPVVVEAGTGTGKSLAYLVPAAMWALANDAKVVVSTFTKQLQLQLLHSDLPLLAKGGLDVKVAVLQGRNNYVCKRRLAIADDEDRGLPAEQRAVLDAVLAWEASSADGSRGDLPVDVDPVLWERVESDGDLTLRQRCPHYATCHYYQARRQAAAAHLIVVNHALLLADLSVRRQGGQGVLPKYQRIVLDEAHHLEDAATGAVSMQLTGRALERAVAPLLSGRRRKGALDRLRDPRHGAARALPPERRDALGPALDLVEVAAVAARDQVRAALSVLRADVIDDRGTPFRVTAENEAEPPWADLGGPRVGDVEQHLRDAAGALDAAAALFDEIVLPEADAEPVLAIGRARRRLVGHAEVARLFREVDDAHCRWVEPSRERGTSEAGLHVAPIDVAPLLGGMLWEPWPGTVATSATLAVNGSFDFFCRRVGLADAETAVFPSPFDHASQAMLGLPRDLPPPDDPGFLAATAAIVVDATRLSGGGAFVLCTSYAACEHYGAALRDALPPTWPVLVQGHGGRAALLARFRDDPRAVLVGTDSFWEGVSVKGDGLRLVVIPRLPFRVPTEPLRLARHERIERRGGDAFRAYSLPEATIKLKQGYGRLIRHRDDRGVVLLLDRRLHDRPYGATMLRALPPARRVVGPWRRVREEIEAFFAARVR